MSHHPERTARNVRPVNQPPSKSYRTFVLEHYGKSKLTAKLVDKFREDVANGKIKL